MQSIILDLPGRRTRAQRPVFCYDLCLRMRVVKRMANFPMDFRSISLNHILANKTQSCSTRPGQSSPFSLRPMSLSECEICSRRVP